jgi:CRP/FNR family transcriptional regulator, cyclic AMP receptor protein
MLETLTIFSALSAEQIALLQQHCLQRKYLKHHIVINEQDPPDCLFIILDGRVKVYVSDDSGKEVILNTLTKGDYFGELSLIDDNARVASVMTTENTELLVMTKDKFKQVLAQYPDISWSLIQDLVQRVRQLTGNVKSLALNDVYGRVREVLLSLAEAYGERQRIPYRVTQQEIANRVGASREMVARILKDLTQGGFVSIEDRLICINQKLPHTY